MSAEDELAKSLENIQEETEQLEQNLAFGLRLATATQILQGLLAQRNGLEESLVDEAIKYADKLIERCLHE